MTHYKGQIIIGQFGKDCGILSSFATSLGIECTYAITVAFIISFVVVVFLLSAALLVFKQRLSEIITPNISILNGLFPYFVPLIDKPEAYAAL